MARTWLKIIAVFLMIAGTLELLAVIARVRHTDTATATIAPYVVTSLFLVCAGLALVLRMRRLARTVFALLFVISVVQLVDYVRDVGAFDGGLFAALLLVGPHLRPAIVSLAGVLWLGSQMARHACDTVALRKTS
jgi:hypothetical protein